ncbi:MAG TPA: Crp/Fnr family transcriptional regulator [Usitatibacter sp.]|jgi:CRP-like cAMP-binding protein|nr:Crp/Fnr family transcriptional regulator [Usitatibacter sp.]
METVTELLQASLWARSLDARQLARVEAETFMRELPVGVPACRKGEPVEHWIGVIDGLVKIASVNAQGKTTTFTGVTSGGWFGEGSLLKDQFRKYDVVTLRESRIAYMPRATFEWLLDTHIGFNRFLLMQLNERLGQFIAMVEHERLLEPDARVARSLASLYNPVLYPEQLTAVQLSQEELGYLSGVSRQRVNQALQVLEKAGLVKIEYGRIRILDLEGLRRF